MQELRTLFVKLILWGDEVYDKRNGTGQSLGFLYKVQFVFHLMTYIHIQPPSPATNSGKTENSSVHDYQCCYSFTFPMPHLVSISAVTLPTPPTPTTATVCVLIFSQSLTIPIRFKAINRLKGNLKINISKSTRFIQYENLNQSHYKFCSMGMC